MFSISFAVYLFCFCKDLPVVIVKAWDADDDTSGTNARLTYSIEKNVVDEKTGQSLFNVHPRTGELRTAICCLDRETTPEYRLQVVASDGGGLKGKELACNPSKGFLFSLRHFICGKIIPFHSIKLKIKLIS